MTKPKNKMPRYREFSVPLPEDVVNFMNAVKKDPNMSLVNVIQQIVYKEMNAYITAQAIIEKESQEKPKIATIETIVKPKIEVVEK